VPIPERESTLIIGRRLDQSIVLSFGGEEIEVFVNELSRGFVRLRFVGPRSVKIVRRELIEARKSEAPK
jgi:sRNA-binding carbon storage regulator CsrA